MDQLEELSEIIAITRWPKQPEEFVGSDVIAEAVLDAGFVKKPIAVTRRMIHNALLKFYPGVSTVKELQDLEVLEKRMGEAIYAAWISWKQEG